MGPVEAVDGSGTVAAAPPYDGAPATAVPYRRIAVGCTLAVLLLAAAPEPMPGPPPVPPPWPAEVAAVVYQGPAADTQDMDGTFRALVVITVVAGPPVTVTAISQDYAGMALATAPVPPVEVRRGRPWTVELRVTVTDCAAAPRGLSLPFVNVTLRNTRAIQTESEILGERYAHDLSAAVRRQCHPSEHRSGAVP
ncbi:Tat pathway signal sequence domain protein [Peterkaempfera sp. SMS 1(5)a]|uniref:Tat pathway signal sequence domain protein n=1 Tax=Peterkaempfera podocarpi TaxID=3232308 RepID=UPI0036706218